ncbi:hypothetical protein [Fusobacterium polymorphum]|jgi:hypothetical protein|uniref:hypothetical protein n=1 Tax=Fusobacterium nucleatum subsp. polymorphum TaxID=76857 RepID=UPI00300B17A2
MEKNINFTTIKQIIQKGDKGYIVRDKILFYDLDIVAIHSLYDVSKKALADIAFIENVFHIDDIEVPTKLAFSLKKQYGDDVSNLLLIMSDGKWFELWIEKVKG